LVPTGVRQNWWDTPEGRERLLVEQTAMQQRFPSFKLVTTSDFLAWDGSLRTPGSVRTPKGSEYRVLVQYPPTFPNQPPEVFPLDPAIEVIRPDGTRLQHQYSDGHMCLSYPGDKTFTARTTAATVTAVAAAWLFAYEYWLASGRKVWPGAEAD
jgi:hypothetical protein